MKKLVPFTTSWDDGFPSDVRVAELLHSHGLLGTFYASTGPSGSRTISDEDLVRIARQHELGNHGRTHVLFPGLTSDALAGEITWGDQDLARFASPGKIVAPPRGRMNVHVVRTIHDLGFHVRSAPVLGTRSRRAQWVEPSLQFYPHGWPPLLRNTLRRRLLPAAPLLRTWVRRGDFRDRAIAIVRAATERTGQVHVWGHSWEIDRLGLWDALDDLLKVARSLNIRPVTNTEAASVTSFT